MFRRQKWKNLIAEAEREVTYKGNQDDGGAAAAAVTASSSLTTTLTLSFPLPAAFAFQGSYSVPPENATFSCMGKFLLKSSHDSNDNTNTTNCNPNNSDHNQNMISISGGGVIEDGSFQITQGKVCLVTGKCYWVETMEQQTSGGNSLCCCFAEPRQTIVIGVFHQDIPSGELCAFQGSWYANNGTSGNYPDGLTLSRYTSAMNLQEPPLAIATATPTPTPLVNSVVPSCPVAPAVPIEETLSSVPSIFRPPDHQVSAVISIPERAASSSSISLEQPTSILLTQNDVVMLDPDPMMTTATGDTSSYFSTTGTSNNFNHSSSSLFHSSMMQPPVHTTMIQEEHRASSSSLQRQSPQPAQSQQRDEFRLPSIFRPPSLDQ